MEPLPEHEVSEGVGGSVPREPDEGEAESGFSAKELAFFAARALRYNLLLALAVAVGVAFVGSTVVAALPNVYDATFKIFVQEGGAVTSALASGREGHGPVDAARGLDEYIRAHDNLLSIVREANLVDRWSGTRSLPMRLKDRLSEALRGPPDRKDVERGFVEMLGMGISGGRDGESVRVHAQWRDGQSAYDIARLVQRNFLAARASRDFGPIQRAIPFLESQLEQAERAIEVAANQIHSNKGSLPAAPLQVASDTAKSSVSDGALLELADASRRLSETRAKQRALAEPWERRIAELKAQLQDSKILYSSDHPRVRQAEARLAAASEVPPDLADLRAKEAELRSTLMSRRGARSAVASPSGGVAAGGSFAKEEEGDSTDLASSKSRFLAALRKWEDTAARLEVARIELAAAQADFEHRYVLIEAPEVPGKPLKQKKPLFFALVFVAAALFGVLAATLRELARDRIVEPWQVRMLGVPLLAEVELKKLPRQKDA